ncbi:MAG: glycoside hydrolase family 3 C-terminal domain-containing protein [Tenericutes bacterium]|nr:glycoside hydrolase family 3 C-terminal domain-containing protein [Mycoplasmatota bacterium]
MNIDQLVKDLTVEEKCSLLTGKDAWNTMNIDRLDIPSVFMADGPHGLRKVTDSSSVSQAAETAVCYPSLVTLASSFDPSLAKMMGQAIASEYRANGVNLILGPGVNLKRHPYCGRNFEYFSEDPLVTIKMATAFIEGAKKEKVGVCLKHFALNSQEDYRMTNSSIADDRAKYELYYRSFQELVKLEPDMVMCAYNKVDGVYASENINLLKEVLRDEFGFKGVIVSDWSAVNDRTNALIASLDLEMPGCMYGVNTLIKGYKAGKVSIDEINASVKRILELVNKFKDQEIKKVDLDKNHQKAALIAEGSMVLLKNKDNMLPLSEKDKVLVIGDMADIVRYQGGGSSHISAYKVDSIKDILTKHKLVYYTKGYDSGSDEVNSEYLDDIKNLAPNYDKIVIVCGLTDDYESEGYDRNHLSIPANQEYIINQVYNLNQNIILVLQIGSPIVIPSYHNVKAILNCYLGGEALGIALDRVLFGAVNPSGRLAETFPLKHNDISSDKFFNTGNNNTFYQESIYLGYRYYASANVEVRYPFGYGLSYTHFEYSNMLISKSKLLKETDKLTVSVDVTNNGPMDGLEVVLLFFEAKNPAMPRPKRELIDFSKVMIKNGETKTISFKVNIETFKYYHPELKQFTTDDGVYNLQICKNARDILTEKVIDINRGLEHVDSVWNHLESYHPIKGLSFSNDDYKLLVNQELSHQHVKHTRPFTINNNLEDISDTRIGKFMSKKLYDMAMAENSEQSPQELKMFMAGLKQMPLRALALISDGKLRVNLTKAIIAAANRKYFKAIKYYFRKD